MKVDWKSQWIEYRSRIAAGILMAGAGLLLGIQAGKAEPEKEAAAESQRTAPLATPATARPEPEATVSDASQQEVLFADRLNLAFTLGEDGSQSLAERLYEELSQREAQWMSQLYSLYSKEPAQLAAGLGIPPESLIGKYNPAQPGQDPANAATWIVKEFKGIQVSFFDGSGGGTPGDSNLKEILAMTDVLYYQGALREWDELYAYALSLWEASHSYTYEISPVYYCQGCLSPATEPDALAQDGLEEGTAADAFPESPAQDSPSGEDTYQAMALGQADILATPSSTWRTTEDGRVIAEGMGGGPGVTAEPAPPEPLVPEAAGQTEPAAAVCPGHVDLAVRVQIAGLEEAEGLFFRDALGNEMAGQGKWPGWNQENMAQAKALADQDWLLDYGLAVEGAALRNPLTSADMDLYLSLVPETASEARKNLVEYALSSVGRVPYYWGGKPRAAGYEGNAFGTVVSADMDGRFLRGLDCSGWISWVYWSATGNRLGGESTSSLMSCGSPVTKEELLPGDICIRPGADAHVVMFLGWTADGQMLCIQETSGNINNVEVGIVTPDWAVCRRIIE